MGLSIVVGLTLGNFTYQALTEKNWRTAVGISLFQGIAIGLYTSFLSLQV